MNELANGQLAPNPFEGDSTDAHQVMAEATDRHEARWAFGSGAVESGAEVGSPLPTGVGRAELAEYCLMLGDDALIYSHRLSEWLSNSPELEEELALANIALDLLGQARTLLARAGHAGGEPTTRPSSPIPDEDRLAYWRGESEFRCVRLVELDDEGDFARAIARLLLFCGWRLAVLSRLVESSDPVIAAVAGKGVKELSYHRDYAARWTVRLGDGTALSHRRMQDALEWAWPYREELFACSATEARLAELGVAVDPSRVRVAEDAVLSEVLEAATLSRPDSPPAGTVAGAAGRQGLHTEQLGSMLATLQSVAREHAGASW